MICRAKRHNQCLGGREGGSIFCRLLGMGNHGLTLFYDRKSYNLHPRNSRVVTANLANHIQCTSNRGKNIPNHFSILSWCPLPDFLASSISPPILEYVFLAINWPSNHSDLWFCLKIGYGQIVHSIHHHSSPCFPIQTVRHCLIGGLNPSEKYEFVSWDHDIPNMMGKS